MTRFLAFARTNVLLRLVNRDEAGKSVDGVAAGHLESWYPGYQSLNLAIPADTTR